MTSFLDTLSHKLDVPVVFATTIVAVVVVLFLLRRKPLAAAVLFILPAVVAGFVMMDLEQLWPTPRVKKTVALHEKGEVRVDAHSQNSFLWKRDVCLALQLDPHLPQGGGPVDGTVRLSFSDRAGGELVGRTIGPGDWEREYEFGGDAGVLCFHPPDEFVISIDVQGVDPRFSDVEGRMLLAVPRHHLVCPENLRGATLAFGLPLWLGLAVAMVMTRRRERSAQAVPELATAPSPAEARTGTEA